MARTIINLLAATAIVAAAPAVPAMAQNAVALTALAPRSVTGVKFHLLADGPVRGGFALAGDRLLFGTETGSLYAVDRNSGHQLWRRSAGSPVLSTPAVIGARAYFTSWDNALHAVDIATGRELWRRDLGRTLGPNDYWEYYVSSPVVAGGRLYVGSGSGRVFSIDPPTGRTMWATDLGARVRTTPLVTADKVIVGTMSGHVVALSRADGHQLWKFATVGAGQDFSFKHNDTRSVVTQPIMAGGIVIAGGRDGNIYGIDLRTGEGRWRETHDGGSWILGLASDGSRFYSGSGSAFIMQAADPATGKELWRSPTANAMFGGLALAGGVLVSNGSNGNLFAYDAAIGRGVVAGPARRHVLVEPARRRRGRVHRTRTTARSLHSRPATAPAPKLDRYVYSFTDEPPASAFWFKPELLTGIRGGFLTSGYERLGNDELAKALASPMSEQGAQDRRPRGHPPSRKRRRSAAPLIPRRRRSARPDRSGPADLQLRRTRHSRRHRRGQSDGGVRP